MSRSFGGRSLTIRSPIVISPPVISSSPATILRVVDLPHPDGPTSTTNSLSRMWRFTSLTACTSSYFLFRSFINTCAMRSPLGGGFAPVRHSSLARSGYFTRLAFDGAGQAGDVVLDEERVDQGHRDGAQEGAGHQL